MGLSWLLFAGPGPAAGQAPEAPFHPDPDRPWVEAADRQLADGDAEGALAAYRKLLGEHPDDFALWLRIGFLELHRGRTGPALQAAERAHELAPEELDTFILLAQAQAYSGDPDLGMGTLKRGLETHPGNIELMEALATLSIGLERYADAAGLLRELSRLRPEHAAYRVDLGRILLTGGEPDEAIGQFRSAIEKGADEALCTALIGKAHLAVGRTAEARAAFERSLALRPNGDAYGGLATIQYLAGRKGEAIQNFRQALKYAPEDADLHYNLANLLAQTDRYEEAEAQYRESLRLDPSSASTHSNLGVLLLNRLAVAEAEQHLRMAVRLDAALPGPHLHLGRIAAARYAFDEAIQHYRAYRARVSDADEQARIDSVVTQLQARLTRSQAAIQRGEIHLLQMVASDEATAREWISRVRRGEDFYVVAQQNSEVAESAGVDVGFLAPAAMNERFRAAVSGLAVGQMTEPIETANGWYVFQRVE